MSTILVAIFLENRFPVAEVGIGMRRNVAA
jgi:hypothetical protein